MLHELKESSRRFCLKEESCFKNVFESLFVAQQTEYFSTLMVGGVFEETGNTAKTGLSGGRGMYGLIKVCRGYILQKTGCSALSLNCNFNT